MQRGKLEATVDVTIAAYVHVLSVWLPRAGTAVKILTDAAYLSPAGLAVIVVIGAIFLCCYCALSMTRSHARYNGQPYYG
jgi:hypothetical protein